MNNEASTGTPDVPTVPEDSKTQRSVTGEGQADCVNPADNVESEAAPSASWWQNFRTTPIRSFFAVIALLVAGVILLSAFNVRTTQISVNVRAGIVDIELKEHVRLNPLSYRDLYWTGDADILLPNGERIEISHIEIESISASSPNAQPITLSHIDVSENSRLRISAEGTTDFSILEISSSVPPTRIMIPPGALVGVQRAGGLVELEEEIPYKNESGVYELVTISGHTERVTIAGRRAQASQYLGEVLPVSYLNFWQIKNEGTSAETQLSTIREGLLILEELGGKRIDLWEGEPIRFSGVDGTLRSLALGDSSVKVQFDGSVDEITSGYLDDGRTLMPSTFGWLINMATVKALLGLVAALIGISLPDWKRSERR